MMRLVLAALIVLVILYVIGDASQDGACDFAENWRQPGICE